MGTPNRENVVLEYFVYIFLSLRLNLPKSFANLVLFGVNKNINQLTCWMKSFLNVLYNSHGI